MVKKAIVYCLLLHLSIVLLLLTSNSSSQSTARPNSGQLHVLRAIMRDWGSPAALSPWSTGDWIGVACNREGMVTALNFNNFHIANPIPASLCSLKNLSFIDLCFNNLTGRFPRVLYRCSALQHLDLSNNEFTSDLPGDMSNISSEMQHLNLSSNGFTGGVGPVVTAIGSLPGLSILDLSNNELSGDIPQEVGNLHLDFLNLSSNNLAGQVPLSMQTPAYDRSFLGNSGLCVAAKLKLNMGLPACGRSMGSAGLIVLFAALSGVVLVGALTIVYPIIQHQKEQRDLTFHSSWKMTAFTHLNFTASDILTNLREENLVGSGGSGNVYRVLLRGQGCAHQVVAVKKLLTTSKPDAKLDKQFDSEVKILGGIQHNNIVRLRSCISSCISGKTTKLLVFEYMENGSLDGWLHHTDGAHPREPLDWPTRLAIAIDAARGLSHMHHECVPPIMHRDVKSSNILLDRAFRAKIGDFGLARLLQSCRTEEVSAMCGTWGYIAPEQYWRKVNEKVDVYSFGVVLLELTTGRVARDIPTEFILAEWASEQYKVGEPLYHAVDGNISDGRFLDDMVAVFKLGVICTGEDPKSRPSMQTVLEHLIQIQQDRAPRTPE